MTRVANERTTKEEVLNFIINFKAENDGNSPSLEEIAEGCGLPTTGTSTASYFLDRLEADGKLRHGGVRSIEVVGGEWRLKETE